MSTNSSSLMSQLSGLRLSDGSVVGSRVNTSTPPSLSTLSSHSPPTAAARNAFPATSATTDPLGSKQGTQRRGQRVSRAEKESESPGSLTDKINRLIAQNQGSIANTTPSSAKGATSTPATTTASPTSNASTNHNYTISASNGASSNSILSSLAAHMQSTPPPASSTGPSGATTFSAPSTPPAAATSSGSSSSGAAKGGFSVPKPRSVETAAAAGGSAHPAPTKTAATAAPASSTAAAAATESKATVAAASTSTSSEGLNPKVMEFFNTMAGASHSPPPRADSTAALKVSVAIADQADGRTGAPRNSRKSPATASPSSSGAGAAASHSTAVVSPAGRGGAAAAAASSAKSATAAASAKETPDPANRFMADAFGNIDNLDATRPFIRTAPEIAADGRYIIVGDVHGCVEQLEQLVEKVKYVKGKDCLLIIGDYVNKGPDSIGVVRLCQRLGAYGVLGNHDYTLLRCCARMRRRPFTPDDLRDPVKRLAQKFPKDCEYYLRMLPHMIRIPRYNLLLVHAGLNMERSVAEQNVEEIMHLRRLEAVASKPGAYKAIAKGMEGEPWGSLWKGPETVIFGHDAFSGFQSHPHACGIDTGCVYGDPLTCVVYSRDSPAGEYFSVPGLPKLENEMKGLPPPKSDIYEQHELSLDKLIIRPTSRATPAMSASMGARPVFLAAPLGYADAAADGAAAAAAAAAKPSTLTATVTSTNTVMSPGSASPSRLATPTCPTNVRLMETTTVNTREVQRATLLALSATRELTAIAVLLAMPLYSSEIDAMLSAEATEEVAQEAFWTPFTRLVLVAAAALSSKTAAEVAPAEAAVQLALDVCQEMESVAATLQGELAAFLESAKEHQSWPKRVVKCAETLVE